MKKSIIALSAFLTLSFTQIKAQDLPQPSPLAKVEQRVGLTDISVTYSRPAAKGRTIFGDLVPYGELWRTGANKATAITFNDDIKINGKDIKAGTYAFIVKPTENEWTVYFNTVTEAWGTGEYKAENDVLVVTAKPMDVTMVESLRFTFENVVGDNAELVLAWDKKAISLNITVDSKKKAMENIDKAIAEADEKTAWRVYRNAANYCAQNNSDLDKGMAWIEKSISLNADSWYSYWVKADLQAAKGDKKGAIASAQKSIEMGEAAAIKDGGKFGYKSQLEESIANWKK
jgi:tetratricopeptide (TPR) repeat protein